MMNDREPIVLPEVDDSLELNATDEADMTQLGLGYVDDESVDSVDCEPGGAAESGLTHSFKMGILRRLMREFNLEDTMDKYRGVMVDGKKPAPRYPDMLWSTHARPRGPKRGAMTDEVLHWLDRQCMDRVEAQMEREYQAEMDRKEEERADLERQRMRRLMVEGIIGQDDLKEDGYATSRERQRPRRGTLHGFKRVRSPRRNAWRSKSAPEHKTRLQGTPPAAKPPMTPQPSQPRDLRRKSSSYASPRQSSFPVQTQANCLNGANGLPSSRQGLRCPLHGAGGCQCECGGPEGRRTFRPRVEDPLIQELQEEETVGGMYSLAEKILPADRPRSYMTSGAPRALPVHKPAQNNRLPSSRAGVVRR